MRTIFADAGYWIALLNPKDGLHQKAQEVSQTLGACRIVTSEMTLAECLNALSALGPQFREKAFRTVKRLGEDPNVEIIPQTSRQFHSAAEYYGAMSDKEWGLTDCSSFNIMKEKKINEALTHDRHFRQAGFRALLREDG